ncbi:FAS1-like dehydratase domain-containing protein [Alkalilacustris brevis]|uniref:FAS1-like dehydratase domain-containing protein n=1 Tax=Alkalilacustris brevis TaxID=2026338 RepID=UPI000E0D639B|nr:MaoC family dehydratase N-terminal domain-containing protein [Alkalilacustris brevis]
MTQNSPATEIIHDVLDPARAEALHVTLGLSRPVSPLLPFAHQVYFWTPAPAEALGTDGHPRVGGAGVIPDMGLPRRMWAGGRLEFHAPLLPGQPAEKHSQLVAAREKTGRSGRLGLVTLRHEIRQAGTLCVTEEQDLVYREPAHPDAPAPVPPKAPENAEETREVAFTSTMLFRYSALTFNGHRIHYDADYARKAEGYAGLVVHGPLLAQLLILMAEEALGGLRRFSFRATAPLFDFEAATLCRAGNRLWVRGPDGRQCMEAEAEA